MRLLHVSSYNKTEEDFNTSDEYNDYLEALENLGESSFRSFRFIHVSIFWSGVSYSTANSPLSLYH